MTFVIARLPRPLALQTIPSLSVSRAQQWMRNLVKAKNVSLNESLGLIPPRSVLTVRAVTQCVAWCRKEQQYNLLCRWESSKVIWGVSYLSCYYTGWMWSVCYSRQLSRAEEMPANGINSKAGKNNGANVCLDRVLFYRSHNVLTSSDVIKLLCLLVWITRKKNYTLGCEKVWVWRNISPRALSLTPSWTELLDSSSHPCVGFLHILWFLPTTEKCVGRLRTSKLQLQVGASLQVIGVCVWDDDGWTEMLQDKHGRIFQTVNRFRIS